MNAEQQQGSIVPGDGDTGGTRGATHVQQQTFTAVDSQRALTDQLMEQVCDLRISFVHTGGYALIRESRAWMG